VELSKPVKGRVGDSEITPNNTGIWTTKDQKETPAPPSGQHQFIH
jgi:hypothetical protein